MAKNRRQASKPVVLRRQTKDTLTAVEMNHGDVLKLKLHDGRTWTMQLDDTAMAVHERVKHGGVVYRFTARVRIDGRPMTLLRYVGTQESFYEPYVIDGVRVWFDAVSAIFDTIPMRSMETQRIPHKHARFALQEASRPICPQPMSPWYANEELFIDVGDCYNGDDCWLGVYQGRACHGGLDINQRRGEPLWAPIDFDDQWYFNSLAAGHNNNRWRGVRKWPSGDAWALQSHHLIKLLVKEHTPLKAGTKYATTAGVHVGLHTHTHFVFKVTPAEGGQEIHLDPWILFWQIFEQAKARRGTIHAAMAPLGPQRTGRAVQFASSGSRRSPRGRALKYVWDFGDGAGGVGARPAHTFVREGVYPVRLVVDDGVARAACTQHVTVSGRATGGAALALSAPDEVSFAKRPVEAMDVYGRAVRTVPQTLSFVARPTRPMPKPRTVRLANAGGAALAAARVKVTCQSGSLWLAVRAEGAGNGQSLAVSADAAGLKAGEYVGSVEVGCAGAANSPQRFRVLLRVPDEAPKSKVTIDDRDAGFACTPCFWVGHRFCPERRIGWHRMSRGHGDFYRTNGGRADAEAFARFTPDLRAGLYEVALSDKTPFAAATRFPVRVRCAAGEKTVRVQPSRSRVIGTFEFDEGADGFVEILAEGSKGIVAADAVTFRRVAPKK